MKLSFSGWRRDCGLNNVLDRDFSDVRLSDGKKGHRWSRAYIEVDETSAYLVTSAAQVTLNGDYCVRIELTKSEVANLARIALGGTRFDEAIDLLAKPPESVARVRKATA